MRNARPRGDGTRHDEVEPGQVEPEPYDTEDVRRAREKATTLFKVGDSSGLLGAERIIGLSFAIAPLPQELKAFHHFSPNSLLRVVTGKPPARGAASYSVFDLIDQNTTQGETARSRTKRAMATPDPP